RPVREEHDTVNHRRPTAAGSRCRAPRAPDGPFPGTGSGDGSTGRTGTRGEQRASRHARGVWRRSRVCAAVGWHGATALAETFAPAAGCLAGRVRYEMISRIG